MTYYSANCAVIAENDDLADKNLVPLVLLGPDKSVGQEWRDNLYKRAKIIYFNFRGFANSSMISFVLVSIPRYCTYS